MRVPPGGTDDCRLNVRFMSDGAPLFVGKNPMLRISAVPVVNGSDRVSVLPVKTLSMMLDVLLSYSVKAWNVSVTLRLLFPAS